MTYDNVRTFPRTTLLFSSIDLHRDCLLGTNLVCSLLPIHKKITTKIRRKKNWRRHWNGCALFRCRIFSLLFDDHMQMINKISKEVSHSWRLNWPFVPMSCISIPMPFSSPTKTKEGNFFSNQIIYLHMLVQWYHFGIYPIRIVYNDQVWKQIWKNDHSYANNEDSNEYHARDMLSLYQSMIDREDHFR